MRVKLMRGSNRVNLDEALAEAVSEAWRAYVETTAPAAKIRDDAIFEARLRHRVAKALVAKLKKEAKVNKESRGQDGHNETRIES